MATESLRMEGAIESMWAEQPLGDVDVDEPWRKLFLVGPYDKAGFRKTDLAKFVYDNLMPVFPHTASVTVGPDRDMNGVFKDLLQQLSGRNYEQDSVSDELKVYLKNTSNRYLILIDDICDFEAWKKIRTALAHTNHGSRVIATYHVATNDEDSIFKPSPPVEHDKSRTLFCRAVLAYEGKCCDNDRWSEVYDKVSLRKCGGEPLAIIALASLLVSKPMDTWHRVEKSINFGRPEDTPVVGRVGMSLSYYGLPSRLRSCLIHLSNFKWTNKVSSIWKWVAEGFLGKTDEGGVEWLFKVGEEYLDILYKTSMIRHADMYEEEFYLEGCRMNDRVLHLVGSLQSSQKYVRMTNNEHHEHEEEVASEGIVSRLLGIVMGGRAGKTTDMTRRMVAVKSVCASHYEVDKILDVLSSGFHFQGLCVLDLVRCTHRKSNGGRRRLTGIGNLVQLKYLGLEGTPVDELEEEDLENLSCLQTLDLRHTGLEKLPSALGELGKLLCLWADDRTTFPAGLLGNLTSLQDLQLCLCSGTAGWSVLVVQELGKLTELRSLRIGLDEKLQGPALAEAIGCLGKMRNLVIRSSSTTSVTAHLAGGLPGLGLVRCLSLQGICFSKMPACIISSSSSSPLTRLAVAVKVLEEADARSLRRLPELTCLNLVVAAPYTGNHGDEDGSIFFPKLTFCTTNLLPSALLPLPALVLETLQFAATVEDVLATEGEGLGFGIHPSLKTVTVLLNCWASSAEEEADAWPIIRHNHYFGYTFNLIKENQGSTVLDTIQVHDELGDHQNPLLGPELAKMRSNQQIPRRIMLEKELTQLDEDLKKLETMVREQPRN